MPKCEGRSGVIFLCNLTYEECDEWVRAGCSVSLWGRTTRGGRSKGVSEIEDSSCCFFERSRGCGIQHSGGNITDIRQPLNSLSFVLDHLQLHRTELFHTNACLVGGYFTYYSSYNTKNEQVKRYLKVLFSLSTTLSTFYSLTHCCAQHFCLLPWHDPSQLQALFDQHVCLGKKRL